MSNTFHAPIGLQFKILNEFQDVPLKFFLVALYLRFVHRSILASGWL
jgi:hypothetical protein